MGAGRGLERGLGVGRATESVGNGRVRRVGVVELLDGSNEAVATAVQRLDHALRLAVVADSLPDLLDAGGERRLRHEAIAPHGVQQLVLGHHPVTVRDQVREDVEHHGFDIDGPFTGPQLVRARVDDSAREPVPHRCRVYVGATAFPLGVGPRYGHA